MTDENIKPDALEPSVDSDVSETLDTTTTPADLEEPKTLEDREPEWWEDPGIPWNHKPTKSDIWCFSLITFVGIFSLVMMPLRPLLLGWSPQILAMIGSLTGTVMTGALAAVGDHWWPVVWIIGSLGNIKFDWIYWWAGWLWGHNLIEIWSGKSERAKRRNDRAVKLTNKYAWLAVFITYTPIPLPGPVVYAAIGAAQTKLWKFMAINWTCSFIAQGIYLYLGYRIGAPAVDLLNIYAKWMTYIALAIFVGMIIYMVVKSKRDATEKK